MVSLQSVLLALLNKQPNTGYGLGRLLQTELSHLWSARLQQIYGELGQLHQSGLVQAERIELSNRPAKKVYALTPEGIAALDEWLLEKTMPHSSKDDLMVRLYSLDRMPDEIVHRLEERQRDRETEAIVLRSRIAKIDSNTAGCLGPLLALEAALSRAEAEAAWCAKTIPEIRRTIRPSRRTNNSKRRPKTRTARK